jgi:hypothetical protein
MERRICPRCDRVLVNAPGPTCSWCGYELPSELQVSKEQAEAMYAVEKQKLVKEEMLEETASTVGTNGPSELFSVGRLPAAIRRFARWWKNPLRRL